MCIGCVLTRELRNEKSEKAQVRNAQMTMHQGRLRCLLFHAENKSKQNHMYTKNEMDEERNGFKKRRRQTDDSLE